MTLFWRVRKKSFFWGGLVLLILLGSSAMAQTLSLDLGPKGGGGLTPHLVQLVFLITVLSLAPAILMMLTSFTRLVVVFSFLRQALGLQQAPPNIVFVSLALFLTAFIMGPTIDEVFDKSLTPYMQEKIDEEEALEKGIKPMKAFMMRHVREKDLALFVDITKTTDLQAPLDTPLKVVIPAFMISELRRAFEIGFLLFLPFLIIDLVVSSILMSMGMMMVPPMLIAMPFKIIFFVLVDGWYLLVDSLVKSFDAGG